eukprot:scaffold38605_cov57-Phaeocystis_antarctica.AAC.1
MSARLQESGHRRRGGAPAAPGLLETDKCPPFLRAIHDLWGHRYIPLAPYACTPPHTGYCMLPRRQASRRFRDAHGGEEPASPRLHHR